MNHALLPSVVNARLPANYTAATLAISKCERIDECKDWADKSAALATYAKQSGDKTLENAAMRIRARAIRRCGELLEEVEKATGAHLKRAGDGPLYQTRKSAAADAGLTPRQAKNAIRVANVGEESFEKQIESEEPPTITALAQQGKKPANQIPQYEKLGMTRAQFQAGMYFRGDVDRFLKATNGYAVQDVVAGTESKDRDRLIADLEQIKKSIAQLITHLCKTKN